MSDMTATIDSNLDAYGEPDAARRQALISQAWAGDGHLVDPPLDGRGHDGIDGMFAAVQGQFAGHRFRRTTGVDAHHEFARYGWELVAPDGSVTLGGMDVAQFDDDGKLVRVVGFFGDPPARDA
jgi:hypothetical protein